ncbi:ribonuclease P protein component [Thalassoroseus pseudoceratinae]|uniref:ribonuclease P protein component n=1 Tax=Thalassoroseus pseudoceratinae TaxID=2713176 RepID=UPI00141D96D7|nr:ribonuclease P protein component [Thalassoroseus pseudoceratinae]
MTSPHFGISKDQRLRRSQDFARIYAGGVRAADAHLLIFGGINPTGQTRFGLSVSKKHGNAVRRGRLKRLLREAFRLSQHDLPAGMDMIFIPRQNSGATLADYQRSLKSTARRLAKRLPSVDRDAKS